MTNQPKPAPTAEEQLPPLDVTQVDHDKYDAEWETRWDGYPVDAICAELYCRERQLLAALRSNREKDAQLAEYALQINAQSDREVTLLARIEKLDDQLDEKDAKIAENFDDAKAYSEVARFQRERAEAAEAKLCAVSEAAKEKIKPRFKHWVTPDGPVHECYLASEVDSLLSRIGKLAE